MIGLCGEIGGGIVLLKGHYPGRILPFRYRRRGVKYDWEFFYVNLKVEEMYIDCTYRDVHINWGIRINAE